MNDAKDRPRRRHLVVLAIVAIALCVLVGGCWWFFFSNDWRSVARTAHPILDAIYEYKYEHGRWPDKVADLFEQHPELRSDWDGANMLGRWEYYRDEIGWHLETFSGLWMLRGERAMISYDVPNIDVKMETRSGDSPDYSPPKPRALPAGKR
jgi:hypothetical protein